jgi:hypothetical protein
LIIEMGNYNTKNRGFIALEALLSASTLIIFFIAFIGVIIYNQRIYEDLGNRQRAVFLAEEGLEAAKNIRDNDYASLNDGTYGIGNNSNQWVFSSLPDATEVFSRQINISTISSEEKQVDCIVNWTSRNNIPQSVSLTTYLSDWAREAAGGCWDNPFIESGLSVGSCANGSKIVTDGDYAYMVKAGTSYFSIINISNTASPSITGICANTNCSLGGLNDVAVQGNYAYIASSTNNAELYTVDISNKSSPRRVATYNIQGNGDAKSVWISNNYLYMTRNYSSSNGENEFLIFSLSNPASPALAGSLSLENACSDIAVSGNYAYVACSDTSREFQVIDISNPASLSLSKRYALNLPGTGIGRAVLLSGNTAYVGKNEGYIYSINITNPQSPAVISSYNFGGVVYQIAGIGTNTIVAGGSNGTKEIQFINTSDPSNMSTIGYLDVPGGNYNAYGVFYDENKERVLTTGTCLGGNSSREFLIINSNCE